MDSEKITFFDEDSGQNVEFFVVEQTQINEVKYLLVTEDDSDEADAYILKEISSDESDSVYEFVDNDTELNALAKVFAEMLDDEDIGVEY